MPEFRKKPVIIEARQFTGENFDEIEDFISVGERLVTFSPKEKLIFIDTLEGKMQANPNDWIIKGIKGEFYPCKPDIFEETYEPVN